MGCWRERGLAVLVWVAPLCVLQDCCKESSLGVWVVVLLEPPLCVSVASPRACGLVPSVSSEGRFRFSGNGLFSRRDRRQRPLKSCPCPFLSCTA